VPVSASATSLRREQRVVDGGEGPVISEGARSPAAAREELGFGLAESRRGRRAVQVLGCDGAPARAGAQLGHDDGDDAVHPADQDRFGRQRELVHLRLHRGALLGVGTHVSARTQRCLQGRRIGVADGARDRSLGVHAVGVDVAQQAEVQEADAAVGAQQVVAGVRVAEGDPVAVEQPEEEAEETISP
jgi:hypothetical protein